MVDKNDYRSSDKKLEKLGEMLNKVLNSKKSDQDKMKKAQHEIDLYLNVLVKLAPEEYKYFRFPSRIRDHIEYFPFYLGFEASKKFAYDLVSKRITIEELLEILPRIYFVKA